MNNDAMRDGYFHGRIDEAPPMPARASAVTLSLDGTTPFVGLAVEHPPMQLLGRDGAYLGPLEAVEVLGFISVDADPAALKEAGKDWVVEFAAGTGQTEVRGPDGRPFFSGTIPLLTGDEGARWLAAAVSQGHVPVIAGPGVSVNGATGDVGLDDDGARWLFAPVTVSK